MQANLAFGQPLGAVFQTALIVPDIDEAITHYVNLLGIGPWTMIRHFPPIRQKYRGGATDLDVSIATAYSGSMMMEIIQQHNDTQSVFTDTIAERGYGLHHYAVTTDKFDEDVARYTAMGGAPDFEAIAPARMDNARVAYFDTRKELGAMLEVVEINPSVESFFASVRAPSLDWDGKTEPVREISPD